MSGVVTSGRLVECRRGGPTIGGGCAGGSERGVLGEDGLLDLLQRGPGIDAELIGQHRAGALVRPQRVGLTSRPVQRGHELGPEALAQRILLHPRFELTDQLRVPAELQIGIDAVLDRRGARLLEPGDHRAGEGVVREVDERVAAPQGERVPEHVRRRLGVARVQRGASFCREPVEASRVERVPRQVERVAPAACRDSFLAERTSQPRDVDLQVVASRDALAAPDVLEELVGRHRVPLGQGEVDEERARTRASDVDGRAVVVEHLERSQDPDLHVPPRTAGVSATRKPPTGAPTRLEVCTPTTTSPPTISPCWRGRPTRGTRSPRRRGWPRGHRARRWRAPVAFARKSRWCASRLPAKSARADGLASDHLGEFPHDDLVRRVKDASE